MKNTFSVVLTAALLCNSLALADEDKKQEDTKQEETKSYSISVTTNSKSSTDGDGEPKSSFSGKIVVVGEDGEKKEYDLADKLPEGFKMMNLGGNQLSVLFQKDEDKERYVIGIMCEPASDVLRSHLKIGSQGLVVTHVSEKMPAGEAGIAKGDIVLAIGDVQLEKLDDLVKAVTESEGKELSFTILKSGDRKELKVTPKKSTGEAMLEGLPEGISNLLLRQGSEAASNVDATAILDSIESATGKMILRRIGPGIRIHDATHLEIDSNIKELMEEATNAAGNADLQTELKNLRKRLSAMEKQLKSVKEKAPE